MEMVADLICLSGFALFATVLAEACGLRKLANTGYAVSLFGMLWAMIASIEGWRW